jgi:hypothetical protein
MPYVIGIVLSAVVGMFARYVGFDRDRAFYPTVMIVIASYYVLFAAMSGSVEAVAIESVVMTLFAAAAVAGFKSSAWIVVVALAGHGVFDAVHGRVIENAGVPAWWPAWCLAYDVGAAAGLAWLLRHGLVTNDVRAGLCGIDCGTRSGRRRTTPSLVQQDSTPLAGCRLTDCGSHRATAY